MTSFVNLKCNSKAIKTTTTTIYTSSKYFFTFYFWNVKIFFITLPHRDVLLQKGAFVSKSTSSVRNFVTISTKICLPFGIARDAVKSTDCKVFEECPTIKLPARSWTVCEPSVDNLWVCLWTVSETVSKAITVRNILIVLRSHYENMPIQIYWKLYHQKIKNFR